MSKVQAEGPILLFDGDCGVCTRSVRFLLKRDRRHRTARFASLSGPVAGAIAERHPEVRAIDSLVWYDPGLPAGWGRVAVRSAAVLAALQYLGGGWSVLARVAGWIPAPIRDRGYDAFARMRRKIPGIGEVCLLPTAEESTRFMDGR